MLVLDPKVAGEFLCGRLLFSNRGIIECRTTSLRHRNSILKLRSITFTALSPGPELLILQARARNRNTSKLWSITTGSLQIWAENCPENFENRAALVGAEIARIEGRDLDAMRLYEQAIRSAREHGFVQNEGRCL